MTEWIVIVGAGVVTFLTRASFIVFADPHKFPHAFRVALAYVPAAVLAAIVVPGLAMPHGALELTAANPRLLAGLAAVVAGAVALLAAGLPYRLALVVASVAGIGAGFLAEWRHRR